MDILNNIIVLIKPQKLLGALLVLPGTDPLHSSAVTLLQSTTVSHQERCKSCQQLSSAVSFLLFSTVRPERSY